MSAKQTTILNYSDVGNAKRLAKRHGQDLRYCYPWKKWLAWNGVRWVVDALGDVIERAKETVCSLYAAASKLPDNERRALVSHARQSESAKAIRAMIFLAQSEPGIPIDPDALDKDGWVLNVPNGMIDLRSGNLLPHDRDAMITKLCPTEYHPTATCPMWEAFLDSIFQGNAALIGFVRRLVGYGVTGSTAEQVLPVLFGAGSNGKSTLITTILELLGPDFAIKGAPEIAVLRENAHPTAFADLYRKRLVAIIETELGNRLAEAQIKELTGSDRIRARRMRGNRSRASETFREIVPDGTNCKHYCR